MAYQTTNRHTINVERLYTPEQGAWWRTSVIDACGRLVHRSDHDSRSAATAAANAYIDGVADAKMPD